MLVDLEVLKAMADLEEARHLLAQYVEQYDMQRLHSALNYLTPAGRKRAGARAR